MTKRVNHAIRTCAIACVIGVGLSVSACTSIYKNYGYVPPEEDLTALVVGVDSKATVDDIIGPPSIAGMSKEGDYYYVRSRIRTYGMFRPEVVERRIVAISFDDSDLIANIEEFGLQDGRIIPLSRRVTDSSVLKTGFLRQLLGNIGQLGTGENFGL